MRRRLWAALVVFAFCLPEASADAACEIDEATFALLAKAADTADDARLDFSQRIAPLRSALVQSPDNVFLHHAFQPWYLSYIGAVRRPEAEALYRQLLAKIRADVALRYAHARFHAGWQDTAAAKKALEELAASDPQFPWSYLALARVYELDGFKDKAKRDAAYAKFFSLCPAPLDIYAYDGSVPPEQRRKLATALRERLREADEPREFAVLPKLWALEFQLPASEHVAIRERITADAAKLRKVAENDVALLSALFEGYQLLSDREGARWARERIAELRPNSFTAARIAMERWYGDRRTPNEDDAKERVQGYYRELLGATDDWIRRWPLHENVWSARFRALRELPEEPSEKLIEAGEGLMRSTAANPSTFGVAPSLAVARAFELRGRPDRIRSLVTRHEQDTAARLAANQSEGLAFLREGDLTEAEADFAGSQLLIVRTGSAAERSKAISELEERARQEPTSAEKMWRIEPKLAAAYLTSGKSDAARAVLGRLEAWLKANAPGASATRGAISRHSQRRAQHSRLVAELAKTEKRWRDAAEAYRLTLDLRPPWETHAERFATIDTAKQLWSRGGGSDAEWNQWLLAYSGTVSQSATQWDTMERAFPAFTLQDMNGREWSQADLRGKTVLVNFWATWCPPCVAELPYIQKAQMALRDRKDALVLTFNVDDNPGVIQPFLERTGATALTVVAAHDLVFDTLKVNGFPRTWILDRDGIVRRQQVGFTAQPDKWLEGVLKLMTSEPLRHE